MERDHNRSGALSNTLSNRPFVVGLLFIGTYFVPFLVLIGLVLAYIFKREPEENWEVSHFQFLIRTFWLAVFVSLASAIAAVILIWVMERTYTSAKDIEMGLIFVLVWGLPTIAVLMLCGVRIILSLMKSASNKPITNPTKLLG